MPGFFELLDFFDQLERVKDDAVTDDAAFVAAQNSRGDLVQNNFVTAVVKERVAGVAAALEADDVVGLFGEQIDNATLTFVAPLCPYDNSCRHVSANSRREISKLPRSKSRA